MRACSLLAAAALAACATAPGDPGWSQIQRERLERLHAPRQPEAALAAVLRQAPRAHQQDPRHIDQREPLAPGTGPRPFHAPTLTATAALGVGTVGVRIAGSPLDDRADATFLHLRLDSSQGVGLHLLATSSDTDLFEGKRINDGMQPARADAGLSGLDAFPHARWSVRDGAFRMPIRAGLFADWQQLDHDPAGVQRDWQSVGPRVVLEPTLALLRESGTSLDLVGHLGGDVGAAWFHESFHGGDDRDATCRWSGEVGLGLRALFGGMNAELGYRLQHTTFGAIDSDLFGDHSRSELQRQQLFLGFGISY